MAMETISPPSPTLNLNPLGPVRPVLVPSPHPNPDHQPPLILTQNNLLPTVPSFLSPGVPHGVPYRITPPPSPASPLQMQANETCWSKVLFGPKEATEDRSLMFVELAVLDVNIIASCRRSEVEKLAFEWEGAIFCFLLGKRPHLPSLKDFLLRKWKLKGSLDLSSQPDGAFIMRFSSSEEKTRILETGPWFISGRLLVLKPWRIRIRRSDLDLSSLPVWIRLLNLPLEFWSRDSLSRIGSIVGKPLFTDEATARKSLTGYARLCIEVSAARAIPSEVSIDVEGSECFKQKITVEWTPSACHHCVSFLHSGASCEAARKADALKINAGIAKIGNNGSQRQSGKVDGWTVIHRRNRKSGLCLINLVEGTLGNGSEDNIVVNAASSVLQSPTLDAMQTRIQRLKGHPR